MVRDTLTEQQIDRPQEGQGHEDRTTAGGAYVVLYLNNDQAAFFADERFARRSRSRSTDRR